MKCEKTKITSTISEITMQPPKLPRPTLKTNISISAGCNFIFLHPHTQPHPRLLTISSPLHISPTHNNSTSLPFPYLGIIGESERARKKKKGRKLSELWVRNCPRDSRELYYLPHPHRELPFHSATSPQPAVAISNYKHHTCNHRQPGQQTNHPSRAWVNREERKKTSASIAWVSFQ